MRVYPTDRSGALGLASGPCTSHREQTGPSHYRCAAADERFASDLADGIPDAPWPPVYPKMPNETPRVQPSRARQPSGD